MKRGSGEGAVPRDDDFGLSKKLAIRAVNGVTENETTRWHRFVRSNHVNHRGPTSAFSATGSLVFHVKHGRRSNDRFASCGGVRKH